MTPTSAVYAAALYAGLNGLILTWLAVHVGRTRMRLGIATGDGANVEMIRAMRGQANFVEYVPLVLLQMVLMAHLETPVFVIHLFGIALTVGRLLHGWHFTRSDAPAWQRGAGAMLTLGTLVAASLGLMTHALVGVV